MTDDDAPRSMDEVIADVSEMAARLTEGLLPLLEASFGVRSRCCAEGYDDDSASRVAADFYRASVAVFCSNLSKTRPPGGTS